jgi:hypothetical protein
MNILSFLSTRAAKAPIQVSADDPLPMTLGVPSTSSVKAAALLTAAFTRPADVIAYAVGDVVAASTTAAALIALALAGLATGRGGVLQNLVLTKNGTGVTNARFRVHFFSSAVATVPGQDNAGFAVLYANAAYYLGFLDFPTMTIGTGTNTGARAVLDNLSKIYACAATDLLFTLEALDAYTPASAEQFTLAATVARD